MDQGKNIIPISVAFLTFNDQGFGAGLSLPPFSSATDNYSDEVYKTKKQTSSLDIDTDRPSQNSLDESYRGNVDDSIKFEDNLPIEQSKTQITYDELRKRNRDEYQQRNSSSLTTMPSREEQPIVIRATERTQQDSSQNSKAQKNKYGDTWQ